jgi:hypothetical protein
MKTLKLFSDKERDYHAYQARQNYLREQRTIQIEREEDLREMERIKQEKEQIEQEKKQIVWENERIQHDMEQAQQVLERERMEKQHALAEIERLKALLAQKG